MKIALQLTMIAVLDTCDALRKRVTKEHQQQNDLRGEKSRANLATLGVEQYIEHANLENRVYRPDRSWTQATPLESRAATDIYRRIHPSANKPVHSLVECLSQCTNSEERLNAAFRSPAVQRHSLIKKCIYKLASKSAVPLVPP
eukprot:764961-Hanusia_phi.AAC.4